MNLTKEQILSVHDLSIEVAEVPEWGGSLGIRTMTGTERDAFESDLFKKGKASLDNLRAKLLARTLVNLETEERLFTDADILELGGKSALVLDRLFAKAQALNGIGKNDVEEMTKNSDAGD